MFGNLVQSAHKVEEFTSSKFVVDKGAVRHEGRNCLCSQRLCRQIMPTEEDAPSCRPEQAHHHADRCRFPSAIWSQEAKNFSFGDVEMQIIYSGERAEPFAEVFEF